MRVFPNRSDWNQRYRPVINDCLKPLAILRRIPTRLRLADLFALIAMLSAALAVATQTGAERALWPEVLPPRTLPAGCLEGLLTGVGLLLLYGAWRARPVGWWRMARAGFGFLGLAAIWCGAIDLSYELHACPHCQQHRYFFGYRVYHQHVWDRSPPPHSVMISEVAKDMGVPCQHEETSYQLVRLWGLMFPFPAVGGICCFGEGHTYAEIQPYVRAMVAENPDLPAEFQRKVLVEHDFIYTRQFFAEVWAREKAARDQAEGPIAPVHAPAKTADPQEPS